MTTKQKHTALKNLAKDAKSNLFEMLKLAADILDDHDYVDEMGGEDVVLERLEAEEFSHFGGSPAVTVMIKTWRRYPQQSTWREYKYNIWALIDLANPREAGAETVRTNWKALAKQLQESVEAMQAELTALREENADMKQELAERTRENAELRGEVKGLLGVVG